MMNGNISDVESKPLWAVKSSIIKFSKALDDKKCLRTEEGFFRDYRGLLDIVNQDLPFSDRIVVDENNTSKSKTSQIVHQWSRQGVTIKKLLEALKKMEREDVVQSAFSKILEDCKNVGTANAQEDLHLLTTSREIWTYQDIRDQHENPSKPLKKYDVVVLYDETDAAFAEHCVNRMRDIGFDVFDTNRDVPIGMIEHACSADIISKRCKNVMLICSEAFFNNKANSLMTQIATFQSECKVFPIIQNSKTRIRNMPPSIGLIAKAVYDPHPNHYNFWEKIMKSMRTQKVLTKATKAMDFGPEQEELEEEPGSSSQSGVISTSHSTLTNSAAGACGGPDADTLVTRLSTSTSISTPGPGEFHRMDSMATTASSIVTTENSAELLLRAPTPPDHDPNSSSKGLFKKLKESYKKKKANKQKYSVPS